MKEPSPGFGFCCRLEVIRVVPTAAARCSRTMAKPGQLTFQGEDALVMLSVLMASLSISMSAGRECPSLV